MTECHVGEEFAEMVSVAHVTTKVSVNIYCQPLLSSFISGGGAGAGEGGGVEG